MTAGDDRTVRVSRAFGRSALLPPPGLLHGAGPAPGRRVAGMAAARSRVRGGGSWRPGGP